MGKAILNLISKTQTFVVTAVSKSSFLISTFPHFDREFSMTVLNTI